MNRLLRIILIILAPLFVAEGAMARELNDKLLNRPYSDLRRWHLGFSVGVQTQDVRFTHNGFVTESGEQWFMEQPAFSPGFTVSGLLSVRLNDYFSVRFSPGMQFGNRDIRLREAVSGREERQNIKSAYVVTPVELKFASQRFRNLRPYLIGGLMPAFDVSKRRNDLLKFKATDIFATVGFGCDFYLPYFKLIPELKFCFGLTDILDHKRPDLADEPDRMKYTQSLTKAVSQMVVLTFYFE
ncbi:MAG: PorT family protein [Muribaculaceae bacterium]|nr:PorT family protein [Muribaculaceae bacterium]